MCSSSVLGSIHTTFPGRSGCIFLDEQKETFSQHLLLFLGWCCRQHGRGQGLLPLHMDCRLGCLQKLYGRVKATEAGDILVWCHSQRSSGNNGSTRCKVWHSSRLTAVSPCLAASAPPKSIGKQSMHSEPVGAPEGEELDKVQTGVYHLAFLGSLEVSHLAASVN